MSKRTEAQRNTQKRWNWEAKAMRAWLKINCPTALQKIKKESHKRFPLMPKVVNGNVQAAKAFLKEAGL
jgi:hypothetical protein